MKEILDPPPGVGADANSPFTLVSAPRTVVTEPRPKTRKAKSKSAGPQSLEMPLVDPTADAVERLKRAVKAKPLPLTPRPAQDEREEMTANLRCEDATPGPGATRLPAPRRKKSDDGPAIDPFESNAVVVSEVLGVPAPVELARDAAISQTAASPGQGFRKATLPTRRKSKEEISLLGANNLMPPPSDKASEPTAEPAPSAVPNVATTGIKPKKCTLPPPKNPALVRSHSQEAWLAAAGLATNQRTPRSSAPIQEVAVKMDEPPVMSRRALKFCCPACNHTLSVPRKLAGAFMRCPQCTSAIRAPHPHKNKRAYNYERNMESLLKPELFLFPQARQPRFMGVPIPEPHRFLVGSAAAMLVVGAGWFFGLEKNRSFLSSDVTAALPPPKSAEQLRAEAKHEIDMNSAHLRKVSEQVVRDFLASNTVAAKAAFVRESARVLPLMEDYYSRHSAAAITPKRIQAGPPTYYSGEALKDQVNMVFVETADGSVASYRVEHTDEGAKIEWESSVAYSPACWNEIIAGTAGDGPHLLRVSACRGDYFNYQFQKDKYYAIDLIDPITQEPLGSGYISKKSQDGQRLHFVLQNTTNRRPEQVLIEVKPVENSSKGRHVEIVRFVKSGFRHVELPAKVASNP